MIIKNDKYSLQCPHCKCLEVNEETQLLNIRGFKVHDKGHWWSECLRCLKWF